MLGRAHAVFRSGQSDQHDDPDQQARSARGDGRDRDDRDRGLVARSVDGVLPGPRGGGPVSASESGAITGSVTDASDAAPAERWRAACYGQDPAATDIGVHGPDWRIEPQPQQVTTRVLRRVAIVESGARMEDRVVVDEI